MSWLVAGLAAFAMGLAVIRIAKLWNETGPAFRRTRLNLLAVVFGAMMLLTPIGLRGVLGPQVAMWLAAGFAAVGIALLIAGELAGRKAP